MIQNRLNKSILSLLILPILFFGCLSNVVYAQENQSDNNGQGQENQSDNNGVQPSVALENPLNNITNIPDLLYSILNIVMILMIPVIVFFIILSGFKYVTARGNASQTEEATQSLLYAIVGGVLILGAIAIAEIIKNVVNAF